MSEKLLPAVVQDAVTGRVLMLAYMNGEAAQLTRETGEVHFWSRSRQRLWKKGETSGNTLRLVEMKLDCDADTWLLRAHPAGPTCHTGSQTCFGTDGKEPPPHELAVLEETLRQRRALPAGARSYAKTLFEGGATAIGAKITEEAGELTRELCATEPRRERIVAEAADLLFHALVGLVDRDVPLSEVLSELARRAGTSGLDEKAQRR